MVSLLYILSFALALHLQLPDVVAGPACARKHFQAADCIKLCKSKWGWSGSMMGSDPWGSVIQKTDKSADDILTSACGTTVARQSTVENAVPSPTEITSGAPISSTTKTPVVTSSATQIISSVQITSSASLLQSVSTSPLSSAVVATSVKVPASKSSADFAPVGFASKSAKPTPVPTSTAITSAAHVVPTTTNVKAVPTPATTRAVQTAASSPVDTGSSTSSGDIDAYLSAHNSVRSNHGASPLTWSDELASKAQQWANGCQFKHSGGSLGAFGENLAAGTGDFSIASAVKSWTDEVSEYDPNNPQPSHFTQVVWKATTQVGCAVQSCDGIFSSSFGKAKYYVCEYSPAGNVIGNFAQNVQV